MKTLSILLTTALATNGQMLGQPLQFTFKAVGFLDVTQVMPADGAEGVDPDADITVMFNRPVVPLVPIAEQAINGGPERPHKNGRQSDRQGDSAHRRGGRSRGGFDAYRKRNFS